MDCLLSTLWRTTRWSDHSVNILVHTSGIDNESASEFNRRKTACQTAFGKLYCISNDSKFLLVGPTLNLSRESIFSHLQNWDDNSTYHTGFL